MNDILKCQYSIISNYDENKEATKKELENFRRNISEQKLADIYDNFLNIYY